MKIKGAIFDMDGTLIDSLMLWDLLWQAIGDRYLGGKPLAITKEQDKAVRTVALPVAMDYLHEQTGVGESGQALLELANDLFLDFYRSRVQLKPGVKEFLDYCRKQGVSMCIATASERMLVDAALKHCNIEDYFSGIVSCTEVGKGKEEPDVYLAALDRLGTPMEHTWVFEDSYVALVSAAKAGFPTVGIYDKYGLRQDIMKETATEYIAEGESVSRLIG